jgi:excisionase family DNA binding protein
MGDAAEKQQVEVVNVSVDRLREIVSDVVGKVMNTNAAPALVSELMTIEQCAELLLSTPRTLKKWIKSDDLPGHKVGAEYRFRRAEVVEWLDARRIKPGDIVPGEAPKTRGKGRGQLKPLKRA